MSLIDTNRTTDGVTAISARAKDVAAQAVPAGKTAVQGVRQGFQGAREWASPHLEVAVQGARDWASPRLEDAVLGAREWAAPRLEDAADAVDNTVAPRVSLALRSTASQIRPNGTSTKTGVRRLLDWRLLLGVGVAAAAAGATAAIAMRRRYATATAAANDATDSPEAGDTVPAGEPATDAAAGSEVNGRVTAPGT